MADYTLSARLTADTSRFTKGIEDAKSKVEGLSNKTKDVGKKISGFGTDLMKTGGKVSAATLPLAALAKSVVDTGMQFETSMSSVQAISGATSDELEVLEATAREMGATTRYSASEAADALGFMALAGWDVEQMTSALPGVLNLATAGQLDLAKASDIVTDMMSMFGMEADEAGRASDVFAAAQAKSNTNVEQLSEALLNAGPAAAAAGMELEETSAVLGILANNGIKGGRAGTILNAMFRDVQASAEDGAIAIGDNAVAVYDAEGNMRSMGEIMADVERATEGMTTEQKNSALAAVFQQESIRGANVLLSEGMDALTDLEISLYESTGAAEEMAGIMDDNLGGSLANMRSAMEEVAIQFFETAGGPLRSVVERVTELVRWFGGLDASTKQIIAIVAALALALGPALIFIGMMATGVGALVTAFGFLMSPVGLVIAGIIGLIAVFILFRDEIMAIWHNTVQPIFQSIMDIVVTNLVPTFQTAFSSMQEIVGVAFEMMRNLWESILRPALQTIVSVIQTHLIPAFSTGFAVASDVVRTAFQIISQLWSSVLYPIFTVIVSVLQTYLLPVFQRTFESVGSAVRTTFDTISNLWHNSLKPILTGITDFVSGVFTGNWSQAWQGVVSTFGGIFEGIKEVAKAPLNAVISLVNAAIGGLNKISVDIPDWIPGVGGKSFGVNIPKIPHLARGTDDWIGGLARINEGGRGELVNLPGGSQVIPHDVSMRYAREAGRAADSNNDKPMNQNTYNNQFTLNAPHASNKDMRPEDWRRLLKQFAYYVNQEGGGLT